LTFAGETVRGEIVITHGGLEGVSVYALSSSLRKAVDAAGEAMLSVDLVPDMALDDLTKRLAFPRGKNSLAN
jgi:predicted flavoprotein YhiN